MIGSGLESWRHVWREAIAPQLADDELAALRAALAADASDLLTGETVSPPPLSCVQQWPAEGCCGVVYGAWKCGKLRTVADVSEHFARLCFEADKTLGEPAGCRWFLNWFDDTPRQTVRAELGAEIDRELARRGGGS